MSSENHLDNESGSQSGPAPSTQSLAADLGRLVGSGNVRQQRAELLPYTRDATPMQSAWPQVVVFPQDTGHVSAVAAYASANSIPLVPRGAGTNLSAATVPTRGGIVMPMTAFSQVRSINTAEAIAVVQPGVTTLELATRAEAVGLMYPPDPGSRQTCTIGGNVATNAGGLRGLKYGVTGDYVLGLEVVLPTGEVIKTGGQLRKDVAGYDLTSLIVGSEGTLAIITEVTVALLPKPQHEAIGVAYFDDLAAAAAVVAAAVAEGIRPSTFEFLDQTCIRVVEDYANLGLDTQAGALLVFGDDGYRDASEATADRIAAICRDYGARSTTRAESVARSADLLAARRCTLPALARRAPVNILEDVGVPRSKLVEMVDRINEIASRHDLECGVFGHAGDGNLHPTLLLNPDESGVMVRAESAIGEIFAAAIELGGTISGEHGIGITKLPYLEQQLGEDQVALLRRIKLTFDPKGILNPGKLGS
ncbi:MAG: FAD-binding protein [Acidimicrobiia bacterium]|nr:FAD-binding protein [Acidimicrobiia bacterium]